MAEFWKENPKFLQQSTKNPLGIVLDRDPKHEWGLFIEMIINRLVYVTSCVFK
jgi:hypothetical protein